MVVCLSILLTIECQKGYLSETLFFFFFLFPFSLSPPFCLPSTPSSSTMIISTPKIDDPNDSNTITMNNTLANAKITADFSYIEPPKKTKPSSSSASIASSNTTANTNENSAQPRHSHARTSTSAHGYVNRVGFDTLSCNDTSEYAFTLQTRTEGYKRTKHTRTFLVGTDMNNYSAHALQWVVENMVEDGDEVSWTKKFFFFYFSHKYQLSYFSLALFVFIVEPFFLKWLSCRFVTLCANMLKKKRVGAGSLNAHQMWVNLLSTCQYLRNVLVPLFSVDYFKKKRDQKKKKRDG